MRVNGRTKPRDMEDVPSFPLGAKHPEQLLGTSQCRELGTLCEKKNSCQPNRGLLLPTDYISNSCLQVRI